MVTYTQSIQNFQSDIFKHDFKYFIENISPGILPLFKCTSQGGIVDESNISASVLSITESFDTINVKTAIFFTEIVGGCNCADDPVSVNAYGELVIGINKLSKEVSFSVIDD